MLKNLLEDLLKGIFNLVLDLNQSLINNKGENAGVAQR
jgi:hypothetical protein